MERFYHTKNCLSLPELTVIGNAAGGDHNIFIGNVTAYKNINDRELLTLDVRRKHKLIRI